MRDMVLPISIFFFFFYFLFLIEVYLMNSVTLVSGIQPNDSVTRIHISVLFHMLSPCSLLHNTEQNCTCYSVGPC